MAGPGVARADSRRRLPLAATLVVVALAIVVIAALTADAMVEPAPQPDAQPVARPPADRGVWYCPVTGQEEERVALSIAAVGDAVSRATVVRYPEGEQREDAPIDLDPGTQQRIVLEAEDARAPVTVRWEGGPVVVSWRAHGGKVVAGPCEPAPASTWYVPGFDTTLGSESTLHLFNPFTTDAVARVSYATPQGMVDLLSTENVPVGAGTSVRLNLNDYQPEQPDLGVIVEVLAGRLVAQGEVRIAPPGEDEEGPKGRTLLPAATTPAQTTWFGYGAIGSNTQSWLAVFNPTDTDTAVEVRVSDPVAELSAYGEVPVNAGTAVRIDLTDHSTENLFGITLEAVGNVPVVAARFTSIGTAEVASTAAALGVVEAASTRAIVGGGADVRAGTVAVYNPGEETIRMTVDAGTRTPAAWTGIELPANGFTTLDVADAGVDRAEIPLRVSADGPVVATLRSSRRNDPVSALWTLPGVPASAWVGPPTRPPVRRDPTLLTTPAEILADETEPGSP